MNKFKLKNKQGECKGIKDVLEASKMLTVRLENLELILLEKVAGLREGLTRIMRGKK